MKVVAASVKQLVIMHKTVRAFQNKLYLAVA